MIEPKYLGDAVYAEYENGMIMLYTSDGTIKSEPIFLELQVFEALYKFADEIWELAP